MAWRREVDAAFATSPSRPGPRQRGCAGQSTPFGPPKLTFDPTLYMTERVFFRSKDGTRVPMFITQKKDLKKNGANPTMLHGVGGFNIATLPTFRSDVPAWLELGGVWATLHMAYFFGLHAWRQRLSKREHNGCARRFVC